MNLLLVCACLGLSLLLIKLLSVFSLAEQVLETAKKANEIGADGSLDDLAKEQQTQEQAVKLLKLFAQLFFTSIISFFGPVAAVYGLSLLELVDFSAFVSTLVSIPVMVVFAVVMILSWSRMRSG